MLYKTRSILSMPIKDADGEVVGVAQAINKISVKDEPFDEHDEKVRTCIYTSIYLRVILRMSVLLIKSRAFNLHLVSRKCILRGILLA